VTGAATLISFNFVQNVASAPAVALAATTKGAPNAPAPGGVAKRLPFLDWTRGLAVLIMIQCHVFNCFTRLDLRQEGPYVLSQFVGGMAAPLFLLLAGLTLAFQMDSQDRRQASPASRYVAALRRAGYILALAYLFRFSNWVFAIPLPPWRAMLRVDILNSMGFAMGVLAVAAIWPAALRARLTAAAGLAIAALSPVMNALDWNGVPDFVRNYLVPSHLGFAFFPCAAYVAFGISAGTILKRLPAERLERTMQWALLTGLAMVAGGQYFSTIPYSIYAKSNFWTDSPALVIIRVGLILAILAAAFLWTEFGAGPGWSWVQTLGKTSLMVYWVHVVLVYGRLFEPWKKVLPVARVTAVAVGLTILMLGLSIARLRWTKSRAIAR
jgi:uncharacterized membrane protein